MVSRPKPGPDRKVSLILTPTGDNTPPAPIPRDAATPGSANEEILFDVQDVPAGRYRVRLRVESPKTESLPVRRTPEGFELDSRQEVQL